MLNHLACIMDGNRRWAKKRNLMPWYGHKEGIEAVKKVIMFCRDNAIKYLSLYTFSIENLNRSDQEKEYLFGYIVNEIENMLPEILDSGIKVEFKGDRLLFPQAIINACNSIEQATQKCSNLYIQLMFCYGGQQEIVSGVKAVVEDVLKGILDPATLTTKTFNKYLLAGAVPPPDLIIRTGGARRLSNFLLYHAAYSELYFLDCMWPELDKSHLQESLEYFYQCRRNFGT